MAHTVKRDRQDPKERRPPQGRKPARDSVLTRDSYVSWQDLTPRALWNVFRAMKPETRDAVFERLYDRRRGVRMRVLRAVLWLEAREYRRAARALRAWANPESFLPAQDLQADAYLPA